jgi:hypothetical protein
MLGPQPAGDGPTRVPKWAVRAAERAGLEVADLREFRGRMELYDIAAVVYFCAR